MRIEVMLTNAAQLRVLVQAKVAELSRRSDIVRQLALLNLHPPALCKPIQHDLSNEPCSRLNLSEHGSVVGVASAQRARLSLSS